MKKLFRFVREQWIKLQLSSPPLLRWWMPRLHALKELARLLLKPWLPVTLLEGQGHGGPLTLTYVGLEYAKPFLKDIAFVEEPREREIGRVPFWRRNELASLASGDVLVIESTRALIRRLPRENAIVMPEFVRLVLDVRGSWEEVLGRFRKTVHKNDLRRIRKFGYEYDVSHDERDFEEFYSEMYLPTMNARHEAMSMPTDKEEAHQYFKHGWLFRIKRDGQWVAGGVSHREGDMLMLDIIGVRGADAQLIEEGAMSARYYAAIQWAHQNGFSGVNFLGSSPYIRIGQFQYKRKWGTAAMVPAHLHRQVWMKIVRNTPAVARFLIDNPLIVVDDAGRLDGLIIVEDVRAVTAEMQSNWEKKYATPGLHHLLMCSLDDLMDSVTPLRSAERVGPIALQPGLEKGS